MKKGIKLLFLPFMLLSACQKKFEHDGFEHEKMVEAFETNEVCSEVIEHKNLRIKRVTEGTKNGHPFKTYSYTITPSDATYDQVNATISFADNRQNVSNYLLVSVDNQNKTFTVECLQAFDSVATIRLSAERGSAYASIAVHYAQRVNSMAIQPGTYSFDMWSTSVKSVLTPGDDYYLRDTTDAVTFNIIKSSVYTDSVAVLAFLTDYCDGGNISSRISWTGYADDYSGYLYFVMYSLKMNNSMSTYPTFSNMSLTASSSGKGFYQTIQAQIDQQGSQWKEALQYCINNYSSDGKIHFTIDLSGTTFLTHVMRFMSWSSAINEDVNYTIPNGVYLNLNIEPIPSWLN